MNRQGQEPSTKQGRLRPIILRASQMVALVLTMTFATVGFQPTPKGVYIQIDDTVTYQETTQSNVADVLAISEIEVEEGSTLSPAEETLVQDGMYITISTPKTVDVQKGSEKTQIETAALTVADLIVEQNIDTTTYSLQELSPQDYLKDNTTLVFNHTEVTQETIQEFQPLGVEYTTDDTLYEDEEIIIQAGIEQELSRTYEMTYMNGELTQKKLLSETVVQSGQPEIIAQGTKVREVTTTAMTTAATMTMEVSGYSIEGSQYFDECIAASGYDICQSPYYNHPVYGTIRIVAADTSIIPMGSIIEIDGFGKAIVLDTGSYIKGYRLDLLFATDSEAYAWGRNNIGAALVE